MKRDIQIYPILINEISGEWIRLPTAPLIEAIAALQRAGSEGLCAILLGRPMPYEIRLKSHRNKGISMVKSHQLHMALKIEDSRVSVYLSEKYHFYHPGTCDSPYSYYLEIRLWSYLFAL